MEGDTTRLYKASARTPEVIDVPPRRFLMIDGIDAVGGEPFGRAMSALFTLAYQVKFAAKKRLGLSYRVPAAEGLYWDSHGTMSDEPTPGGITAWRLMVALPDEIEGELVDEVRARAVTKRDMPELENVRVQTFSEGMSVQMLHVGPYAEATNTAAHLHRFAAEKGLDVGGPHHEIYLSDPDKTAPAKLKTILRYPVRRR